ncbi:MAG: hypothetical protein ACE5Z5_10280 [Candidatus Bathyarchaeia archaeon]
MGGLVEKLRRSSLARMIRKIRLPQVSPTKPPSSVIVILMVLISIFILGGGVYNIMMKPLALLPTPTYPIFFYFGLHEQMLSESLIFIFLLIIGVIGGYLAYRSTRYLYRPREAMIMMLIGVTMLFLAFIGCEYVLGLKGLT